MDFAGNKRMAKVYQWFLFGSTNLEAVPGRHCKHGCVGALLSILSQGL